MELIFHEKENEIFSSGDFFYNGMFCIGKLIDGSYGAFDNAEDYESYKRTEKEFIDFLLA